jgi:predicted esterase
MLIFLLGYAGDVPSFCWVVASAAAQVGWTTHCPSCGFTGAWWEPECSSRVHRIAGNAREQGRVVLGGLSNGARGAATLVTAGLHDLDDALLISGGAYETGPGPFALLMIYGLEDARFPTDLLERYAATAGDNATVVPRPFGHFLLTKDFETVRSEIRAWLRGLPG